MKLTVKSKFRNYKVAVEDDFSYFRGMVLRTVKGDKICLVSDANADVSAVKNSLKGYSVYEINFAGGESVKTSENFLALSAFLYKNGFSRKDALIAAGGGTISDLVGFTASAYMRGIKYINVPTTLLSCVDACIGGKTAIDACGGKNILGAFYPPAAVFVNAGIIKDLPEKEILSGKGEIAKYALLSKNLTAEDAAKFPDKTIIKKCLGIKAGVVKKDEFDTGVRKTLNLGHTVAHAYEEASGFTLSHGEAVARGLYKIISASQKYFGFTDEDAEAMRNILVASGFGEEYRSDLPHAGIAGDKKAGGGYIDLVLLKRIGEAKIVKMPVTEAERLLGW